MSGYRHLFGPVPSRRLGRSLGVDLNPVKVCSEDCVFCQIGRTTEKTLERREWVDLGEVRAEWERWLRSGVEADCVTLSGSGEPTLHSRFGEVLDWARAAGRRCAVLSNGSLLWNADVRRDAAKADIVKVTVSAWDEESFERLHRPAAGLEFGKMLEGIRRFREEFRGRLWVETMVLPGFNDREDQLRAVAEAVKGVRADAVHLNTATRPSRSAGEERVEAESAAWLAAVSGWFSPRAEVPVFKGTARRLEEMDDDEICALIARHPMPLAALAAACGEPAEAAGTRLEGLVATGRLRWEGAGEARVAMAAETVGTAENGTRPCG